MTRLQAKQFVTICALAALVPALMLAGILGFDKAEGGVGFFPFLIYVSALLLSYVLLSHFAPLAEDQSARFDRVFEIAKIVGLVLTVATGSATFVFETLWDTFGPALLTVGCFIPPAGLLVSSFITRTQESDQS